ncbi:DoxX family membrane protein [Nakamurella silvestris]|nr:DoxX family membrane protein [Nakamurella silvestris]
MSPTRLTTTESATDTPRTVPPGPGPHAASTTDAGHRTRGAHPSVDILRVALGLVFLWAFLDKAFGWSYSTGTDRAWVNGGSPTNGFLSHVNVGPLQSFFRDIAGKGWADWLFMLGLLGIGLALILGVALRIAAVGGTIMMLMMWAAEWPPAQFNSLGEATGSSNPLIDYHIVYAIGLWVVLAVGSASALGAGRWWSSLSFVQRNRWAR